MSVNVERIEIPADDASPHTSKVAYMGNPRLSDTVESITKEKHRESTTLHVSVHGDQPAANIQKALETHGLETNVTSPASNSVIRILSVYNADPAKDIITLVAEMGKLGKNPGGISREVADQIIEKELAGERVLASERNLVTISTMQARDTFAAKARPTSYIKADINYALSPVRYLEENGQATANGSETFTRFALKEREHVINDAFKALEKAGIKTEVITTDHDKTVHANAHARADKVSAVLQKEGLLMPSIAKEIEGAVAQATAKNFTKQPAGVRST